MQSDCSLYPIHPRAAPRHNRSILIACEPTCAFPLRACSLRGVVAEYVPAALFTLPMRSRAKATGRVGVQARGGEYLTVRCRHVLDGV
jgi:hypothetical protein